MSATADQATTMTISEATAALDRPLNTLGFKYELISPRKVTGKLKVTENCCQPFGALNGGVSAMMAESVASLGAYVASGFNRVAGIQLSTNHIKAAVLGDVVEVEARPIQAGKTEETNDSKFWLVEDCYQHLFLITGYNFDDAGFTVGSQDSS